MLEDLGEIRDEKVSNVVWPLRPLLRLEALLAASYCGFACSHTKIQQLERLIELLSAIHMGGTLRSEFDDQRIGLPHSKQDVSTRWVLIQLVP